MPSFPFMPRMPVYRPYYNYVPKSEMQKQLLRADINHTSTMIQKSNKMNAF